MTTDVGKDVDEPEFSFIAGGSVGQNKDFGKVFGNIQKILISIL